MRKSVTRLIVTVSMSCGTLANATYVIKLKNGNEYVTNRYWQEGTQVLFDADGGIFGIDKAFVGEIEKTNKVIKLITNVATDPAEKPAAGAKETNKDDATKAAPADATNAPITKDDNDPVYKEYSALKAQAERLRAMSSGELNEYVKTLAELMSKIQKERKTSQYRQEYGELNALANSAEEEIKARR
jgi:hypothetical protein